MALRAERLVGRSTSACKNVFLFQVPCQIPAYPSESFPPSIGTADEKAQTSDPGSISAFETDRLEPQSEEQLHVLSAAFNQATTSLEKQAFAPQHVPLSDEYSQPSCESILLKSPIAPPIAPSATSFTPPKEVISQHAMPNSLPRTNKWIKMQPLVARLRDKGLTTRVQIKEQRRICSQRREECHGLQRQLTESFHSALASFHLSKDPNTLTQLVQGFQKLFLELDTCMEQLEADNKQLDYEEDYLSDLEYRLGKKEGALFHYLDIALAGEDVGYEHTGSFSGTASSITSHEAPQIDFDPLLKELYSKMGDRNVYRDRLIDFNFRLQQELEARETLRGEGKEVGTDEEFYTTRLPEQTQIQVDLDNASADVRHLRQLCLDKGINIDSANDDDDESTLEVHSEVFSAPTDQEGSTMPSTMGCPPRIPQSIGSISPGVISGFLNTRERVRKWLVDAPLEAADVELPINYASGKDQIWVKLVPSSQSRTEALQHSTPVSHAPGSSRPTPVPLSQSDPYIPASPTYGMQPRKRACSSA